MNSTQIKPSDVQATLSKHILADGYDMVDYSKIDVEFKRVG